MKYSYVAYTIDKKIINDTVIASSDAEALDIISNFGHKVLKLDKVKSFEPDWSSLFPSFFKVKPDELIVFSRQLKLLIEAGNDIVSSLELLQNQITNSTFKKALNEVISDIRSGSRVADAMSKHSNIFPPIYCRSISVGEQTGEIAMMLNDIAGYLENELNNKKGLKSALAYPMIVSVVAVGVVAILSNFVLPTFENLYTTMDVELPAITKMFLSVTNTARNLALPVIVVLAVVIMGLSFYFKTTDGKYQKDKLSLRMPMIGLINRLNELAYCCRTMAVLFRSGLSSTEIMDMVIDSSTNTQMAEALSGVKDGMLKGEGLSKPMSNNSLFMPMMVEMVRVGEETGGLGDTLVVVAQTYAAEAQAKTRLLKAFIQTAVMIGITLMVSVVVLSMLSAMYGVYGQLG